MSATFHLPRLGLLNVLEGLLDARPVAHFGAPRSRHAEGLDEETLALMPPHLRDDVGLPPLPQPKLEHPTITQARTRGRNWW